MQYKIDDISKIIKEQIKHYAKKTEQDEIGYVISVGDGISKVHGLDKCKANELLEFSKLIGNRQGEYYYASVGDIFAYEDAVKSAEVTEGRIKNNSALTLYATVDGERITVAPYTSVKI